MRSATLLVAALARGYVLPAPPSAPARSSRVAAPRLMFSGIVEEMGSVRELEKVSGLTLWDGSVGDGWELEVEAKEVLQQASLGCSIAVNGVCLTATAFDEHSVRFGLAPETLRLTNLADLTPGSPVNLERALAVDARNSGHFVQGHVDDVGVIEEMRPEGDSLWVRVRPPERLLAHIVPKGFVAVDGTSLTVCEVNTRECWFDFMLVAYTQQKIIVPQKRVGDKVNLEVDVLSKYVEQSQAGLLERVADLERRVAAHEIQAEKRFAEDSRKWIRMETRLAELQEK